MKASGLVVACVPARKARSRRRRDAGGFTLVELTVALLAGLIVAMGIVSLSREATSTFHEEARSSAAEAALRTAVDRLRADLQRAGYMSTGNIGLAPRLAYPLVAPGGGAGARVPAGAPSGIKTLTSVSLTPSGSLANGLALSAQQPTALTPDLIQITGNMTSADEFDVASVNTAGQPGCTRIYLAPNSPAVVRVIGATAPLNGGELKSIFFPSTLPTSALQFIVRLVDTNQCAQYLATCKTSLNVAGLDPANNLPYVDVDPSTPIVTASAAGTSCGVSGFGEGSTINPVVTVRWEITAQTGAVDLEPVQYASLETAATTKYDLMRSYVDATGTIVPDTSEIIAEYAVDLSFAFSVETGTALNPTIVTYPFDDPNDNNLWGVPAAPAVANRGPQRIRAIRARLVTRTAIPDRSVNILVAPAYGTQEFAYRYCVLPNGCSVNTPGVLQWARTRTIVTEVALPNQAGNFY
jgi:type II secretory pathway pseudopilin PulG